MRFRRRSSIGIDAQLARGHVDHALDREGRLGPARAAIGAGGRGVGEHARGLMVDGRRRVHAGHAADVVGAGPRAALGEIRADVEVDRHAQREERPVPVEGQLGGGDVVTAVLVGDESLAPVRRPLHRPSQPARGPQHQDHLGVEPAAHAEAAADLAGDHAHVALRDLEGVGEQGARAVRSLDAGVQRVAPAPPVVLADGGAGLERRGGHPGDDEVDARDVGGAREGLGHGVALAGLREERDVVGHLVPHGRRPGTERVHRGGDRGQGLVVHRDLLGGVHRRLVRLGDHERDGVTDVTSPPTRQRGAGRGEGRRAVTALAIAIGREIADVVGGQVVGREDREHARRRERRAPVDPSNARVGVGRAHQDGPGLTGKVDVVRVATQPLHQPRVLDPAHGLPDGELLDDDRITHDRRGPHS